MSKYDALGDYLNKQITAFVPMTFREIEKVTGRKLPSSKQYAAWWSNNPGNNVMTKVWLDAGFRTEQVDVDQERLVFRRVGKPEMREGARAYRHAESSGIHAIIGALKGTFTIEPGWDLTRPAFEELAELDAGIEKTANLIEDGFRRGNP